MGETSPDSVFANFDSMSAGGNSKRNNNDFNHKSHGHSQFFNLPNQRSTSAPLERQHEEETRASFHTTSSSLWETSGTSHSNTRTNAISDESDILDHVTHQYGGLSIGNIGGNRLHRSTSAFGVDNPNSSSQRNTVSFLDHEERGATAPPASSNLWSHVDAPSSWADPPAVAVRPAAKTLMELIQEQDTLQTASQQQQQQQQRLMVPPGYAAPEPAPANRRWVLESTSSSTPPSHMYQLQPRPQQVILGNPQGDYRVVASSPSYPNATYHLPPAPSYWQQQQQHPPTNSPPHSPPYRGSHRTSQPQQRRRPTHPRNYHHRHHDYAAPPSKSSSLLEEFRSSKRSDWTIRRIVGHIVEFCQDQNGSRFIQQRLELGDSLDLVLNEVLPCIHILRIDVFGNYVVQKLLDFGNDSMRSEIRRTLEGEMVGLSLQMYGCRVVQKALETLSEDELPLLLKEFHHNVLSLIHDQNGNHVMQKCVEVLNTKAHTALRNGDAHRAEFLWDQVDFIVQDVLINTKSLSCHPYGCRVFQRMLEHCNERRKLELLDIVRKSHETLLDDQYGNYVIQHVLQYGRDEDRNSILAIIQKHGLLGLSRQKFASNVVEKLLKYGNGQHRRAVIREMLKKTDDPAMHATTKPVSIVLLMVRDAYANYVVQTTLDVAPESPERRALLYELNSHVEELRNYTFAKHIVAKLSSGR